LEDDPELVHSQESQSRLEVVSKRLLLMIYLFIQQQYSRELLLVFQ
jgi:hypothetical protein